KRTGSQAMGVSSRVLEREWDGINSGDGVPAGCVEADTRWIVRINTDEIHAAIKESGHRFGVVVLCVFAAVVGDGVAGAKRVIAQVDGVVVRVNYAGSKRVKGDRLAKGAGLGNDAVNGVARCPEPRRVILDAVLETVAADDQLANVVQGGAEIAAQV